MRRLALVTGGLGAVVFAWLLVSFATRDRDVASAVPVPSPLRQLGLVELGPAARACMAPVVIDSDATAARFVLGTFGRPSPPLEIEASATGYRTRMPVRAGYPDNAIVEVPIRAPRSATAARFCVVNRGERRVALYASGDGGNRARTTLNGKPGSPVFVLRLDARPRQSLLSRWGTVATRITAFRPPWVTAWLVWLLAFGVAVAVPAALVWAFVSAAARDDRRERAGA